MTRRARGDLKVLGWLVLGLFVIFAINGASDLKIIIWVPIISLVSWCMYLEWKNED